MTALENQFPPLAQALGRLRQPRGWPYAPRATEPAIAQNAPRADATNVSPEAAPTLPDHDFLRMMPEPALTGDLPEAKPANPRAMPAKPAAAPAPRETLTAVEAIALAPLNRTYWFDL